MYSTTDITLATSHIQPASWQQRKQDYAAMMAAILSGDLADARRAYKNVTAGRSISPISPLAALGTALQRGDAAAMDQAARALHHARTGLCYRHRARADAPAARGTRARRERRGAAF